MLSLPQRGRGTAQAVDEEVAIKIFFMGVVWILFVAQGFFCIETKPSKDVKTTEG